jgi:hypothetical protein
LYYWSLCWECKKYAESWTYLRIEACSGIVQYSSIEVCVVNVKK